MLRSIIAASLFLFTGMNAASQNQQADRVNNTEIRSRDTIVSRSLQEATVSAFGNNSSKMNLAAAVNVVDSVQLQRGNTVSLVQAVNQTPGVRMEERSPGSYRLSIRGSTLRSSFGVRNVRIYYNDIPLTDPGGFSYLNALGYYNITGIEILKGPGSSLYGAGTGGVMLITSNNYSAQEPPVLVRYTGGSYGLQQEALVVRLRNAHTASNLSYQHQQSNGYREHSAMKQDAVHWNSAIAVSGISTLSATILYSHLNYDTPGALTLSEFEQNPRAARPGTPTSLSAVQAKAGVHQDNLLVGFSLNSKLGAAFSNKTVAYGALTRQANPSIREYARTAEGHFGARTIFEWQKFFSGGAGLQWLAGAEAQQYGAAARSYQNKNGQSDTLRSDDDISNTAAFAFTQLKGSLKKWSLTGGLSLNQNNIRITRLSQHPAADYNRRFSQELAPRLALLYAASSAIALYGVVSKGFSPPTLAELSPGGGDVNQELQAETGWNTEAGVRGSAWSGKLNFDASLFLFSLRHAIVLRRDAQGGDYYLNAGGTKQAGAEASLAYVLPTPTRWPAGLWLSYTYYHFRYQNFRQYDKDFSGKELPGAAPHTMTGGLDVQTPKGFYVHLTAGYQSDIPLNDANDRYAAPYCLFGAKLGWAGVVARYARLEAFAGGENLSDVRYGSGNDINAFGGRYYNASPGRNYYVGLGLGYRR